MVVAVSSLSVAIQGIADYLDTELGPEVSVSVDSPQAANETAKASQNAHLLNLFVYRISPSGFHADSGGEDLLFIRLNALLTPFLGPQQNQAQDADLRILGHAIRVLSSQPELPPVLPGPAGADPDDFRTDPDVTEYRVQAVLQHPSMEELNHIWTTQGGDLAYRLSAAYEFAMVPIEPTTRRGPPVPTRTAILDASPDMARADEAGFIEPSEGTIPIPVGGESPANPTPPTSWLPILLAVQGDAFTTQLTIAAGDPSAEVAVAGPVDERISLEVTWTRAASPDTPDPQSPQVVQIQTPRFDLPEARVTLALNAPLAGDVAVVRARPVDNSDQPLAGSPFANTITLTVPEAP